MKNYRRLLAYIKPCLGRLGSTVIAAEISKLYRYEPQRDKVAADLKISCAKLGKPGAAKRVAQKILEVAGYEKLS